MPTMVIARDAEVWVPDAGVTGLTPASGSVASAEGRGPGGPAAGSPF
jgi:hypothetical protein